MKRNIIKINVICIITFFLFFSLFKIMYIPSGLRQAIKITSLVAILIFLLANLRKKYLINVSLVFSSCVIASGVINYMHNANTFKSLIEAFIYALAFYDTYTAVVYFKINGKLDIFLKYLYRIVLLFTVLNLLSIIYTIIGNGNATEYLLGNKFSSAYMLIFLISLFGATHDMEKKRYAILLILMIIVSMMICFYLESITALVSIMFVLVAVILKKYISKLLVNPISLTTMLIMSSVIVFAFDKLLSMPFINRVVFDIFGKSISIFGRQKIYNEYFREIVEQGAFAFGRGYNNSEIYNLSGGVFGNAQNGLAEHFISFGIIGVCAILFTLFVCVKKSNYSDKAFYIALTTFAMIVAATVEVSINWFFFFSIFIISCLEADTVIDDTKIMN